MRQLILLLLLIVVGGTVLRRYGKHAVKAQAEPAWKTLTPEEAKALLDADDTIILLDVRTQAEFDAGHVPGAVCLPNESIGQDMPVAFDADAPILVYCRTGHRSAQAAETLARMGYTNVGDFGGLESWPYETVTEE